MRFESNNAVIRNHLLDSASELEFEWMYANWMYLCKWMLMDVIYAC